MLEACNTHCPVVTISIHNKRVPTAAQSVSCHVLVGWLSHLHIDCTLCCDLQRLSRCCRDFFSGMLYLPHPLVHQSTWTTTAPCSFCSCICVLFSVPAVLSGCLGLLCCTLSSLSSDLACGHDVVIVIWFRTHLASVLMYEESK